MTTSIKSALITLLALFCINASAQKVFINLTASEVKINDELPQFSYSVPLGDEYADSLYTVDILYPEFIDVGEADMKKLTTILKDTQLPEMPEVSSMVVVDRKKGRLLVSFTPIVFNGGKYRKLVSFMLNVKGKAASAKARKLGSKREPAQRYASHSVLATGKWAKIRVAESGIYQITDALIKRAGFTDLSKVSVYGYGGALQNEKLVEEDLVNLDDLKEVPTCILGGKRLFHAQGPVTWESPKATYRTRNPYSDYGYYFITQNDAEPLVVDSATFVNSFYPSNDDYHSLHEVDNFAWFEGGNRLFEETPIQEGASKTYTIETPGLDTDGRFTIILTSNGAGSGMIVINDSVRTREYNFSKLGDYDAATDSWNSFTVKGMAASNTVKITNNSGAPVRLDYISTTFNTPRPLPDLYGTFPAPEYVYNITNQDLHADSAYQMVIIVPTSQKLTAQAERLKAYHEMHDGMRIRLVPADELYNEFSSGTPDVNAYRRYMKMLYDRAQSEEDMPKYLLLFGDCAWDNRMNSSAWKGYSPDDFLLCYESENSYSEVDCYVNDGYFCSLDDGEGDDPLKKDMQDIAVGRFPVRNAEEAKIMVDKAIAYMDNKNGGDWQNTLMFMGDDGNNNIHMDTANEAAKLVEKLNPGLQVKRVMWDAYTITASSTGNTYPDVTKAIRQQQGNGALVMNYCGHGAQNSISHERVLSISDFENFSNANLPLWITASCDIAPFDSQTDNIGEKALLNRKGGAIAFFGTTRTVYTNRNKNINIAFLKYLFTKQDGKHISIGEAQRLTKNYLITPVPTEGDKEYIDSIRGTKDDTQNKLQYSLLGDPALVLNIPQLNIVIDSINGKSLAGEESPLLKAGSIAKVYGHIERDGAIDSTFNGMLSMVVRDSEEHIVCRLNNTTKDGAETPFVYNDRTKVLFNGTDSVRTGCFNLSFAVPMDINYSGQSGLINLFAITNDKKSTANGYCDKFMVGGTEDDLSNDMIGPSIYCYLNSPSFTNGDDVNTTPYFVAQLDDKDGLNSTGNGIGHDMQLVIDNDVSMTYNLNDYFVFDFGSYTSGSTSYHLPELLPGIHKLRFRAWDIMNNSSTSELTFNVVRGLQPTLFSVGVTENPVKTSTKFIVNHDRNGSNMDVAIEILDMSGRTLWRHEEAGVSTSSAYTVDWDMSVDGNHKLGTGVYLYRVSISSEGSSNVSKTKKLIVINNN